jgi:hypothetical protein
MRHHLGLAARGPAGYRFSSRGTRTGRRTHPQVTGVGPAKPVTRTTTRSNQRAEPQGHRRAAASTTTAVGEPGLGELDARSAGALVAAGLLTSGQVLGLQRVIGNQSVQRVLAVHGGAQRQAIQRDYITPPPVALDGVLGETQFSTLREKIQRYRLAQHSTAKVRRERLREVAQAFKVAPWPPSGAALRVRDKLLDEIKSEQGRLTEAEAPSTRVEPEAAAGVDETLAEATASPARTRTPAVPAKLPATPVFEPAKGMPSSTEAKTAPAPETQPAERSSRDPTPKLNELLAEIEAADVTMDRLVEHLTKLRNARKGDKWADRVSADYTKTFDVRLAAASKKFNARVDLFGQTIQQLESAEGSEASAREREGILVKLTERRKNPNWTLIASAAATTDFDARLSGLDAKVVAERKAAGTRSPAALPETGAAKRPVTRAEGETKSVTAARPDADPAKLPVAKAEGGETKSVTAARPDAGPAKLPVAKDKVETKSITAARPETGAAGRTVPKRDIETKPVTSSMPATIEIKHRPPAAAEPWAANPATYLKKTFDVTIAPAGGGAKEWTNEELAVVARVLTQLGTSAGNALKGVSLTRVKTLGERRARAGTWETLALFSQNLEPTRPDENTMSVSDLIFERMSAASGGASEGALSLAHETAHALETETVRPKVPAWRSAQDDYNRKREVYVRSAELAEKSRKANVAVIQQKDRIGDRLAAANRAYDDAFAAQDIAEDAYNAAIDAFNDRTGPEAAIAAAKRSLDAAKAHTADTNRRRKAVEAEPSGLAAELARTKRELAEASAAMDAADKAMATAKRAFELKNAEIESLWSKDRKLSSRVLNFERFVNTSSIPTDLTAYAAAEWPAKPHEFYAEAFAYFVLAPERLKSHSAALHQYFETSKHLNDAHPT